MARIRERKTRDINQIKCIKDGVDRLLVRDEEIKDRWREYFDKLFNGEEEGPILELDDSFDDNNRRFVRRNSGDREIEEALKRMKSGKAMGPDGIPIEMRPPLKFLNCRASLPANLPTTSCSTARPGAAAAPVHTACLPLLAAATIHFTCYRVPTTAHLTTAWIPI
ncbi:hypothetical protein PR202_gb09609 [Eleusine coracana subsp. coracana]|uniref:Uncharacterized protein n=1 Tax=Eleusine coracana subsp. coracana TaxID=191504 RepID=A0AAV5EHP2_ELECO|nr:hypothetical protein PR202_gb09609 [Eleusine coracana subsp. coracana]